MGMRMRMGMGMGMELRMTEAKAKAEKFSLPEKGSELGVLRGDEGEQVKRCVGEEVGGKLEIGVGI